MIERLLLVPLLMTVVLAPGAGHAFEVNEGDFRVENFRFESGETLPELKLHYRTLGTLQRDAPNSSGPSAATSYSPGNFLVRGSRLTCSATTWCCRIRSDTVNPPSQAMACTHTSRNMATGMQCRHSSGL